MAHPSLIEQQASEYYRLTRHTHVEQVFVKYASDLRGTITLEQFKAALRDLPLFSENDHDRMFKEADINKDSKLDFEEFSRAVSLPSKLEQYLSTLPLAKLLAFCLTSADESISESIDPVRAVSRLSPDALEIGAAIFHEGLKRLLDDTRSKLRECYDELERKAAQGTNAKFQTFTMSCGTLADFANGLSNRVGYPLDDLSKGMRDEHCVMYGHNIIFLSSNYGLRTTPRDEYMIATGQQLCPRDQMLDKHGHEVRVIRPIELLMGLDIVKNSKLGEEEVTAVVLYTGPMFQLYNTILRQFPADAYQRHEQGGNLFATTIHILVSAVIKVARAMRIPQGLILYRGLGGDMKLPDQFYQPDHRGCRGYMEWGFLSTTTSWDTAVEYSGFVADKPLPTLLRITTGAVDRGACISELSQYPGEEEHIWVPCSFVQPDGPEAVEAVGKDGASGVVTVVRVRINSNLKSETVEELRDRKKKAHLASFAYANADTARRLDSIARETTAGEYKLSRDPVGTLSLDVYFQYGGKQEDLQACVVRDGNVTFTVEALIGKLRRACDAVLGRHRAVAVERYNQAAAFRRLVEEMLETGAAAESCLRWYLEDPSHAMERAMRTPLVLGRRGYLMFLRQRLSALPAAERPSAAARLCVELGAMEASPREVDATGETPLVRAAAEGAGAHVLRSLVAARADVNQLSSLGTPLYLAAGHGHDQAAEELLRLGTDPNDPRLPFTPLSIAAVNGHPAVIELLGRAGADPNRARPDGMTPLHLAAQQGRAAVIEALGRLGADANPVEAQYGGTPMHNAANAGHADAVQALGRIGAEVNRLALNGQTPLDWALARGHMDAAAALQRLGAWSSQEPPPPPPPRPASHGQA